MRLPSLAVCVIIGISPLVALPELPGVSTTGGLTLGACLLLFLRRPALRYMGVTLLCFCWGVLSAQQVIWPVQRLTGNTQTVDVLIRSTDGQTVHQAEIVSHHGKRLFPAPGITLYGGPLTPSACAGQRWRVTIRARAVHGQLNDGAFDSQRLAFSRHRMLSGAILAASPIDTACSLRARYLASLQQTLAPFSWRQVIIALGMGERLSLPPEVNAIMQQTGTLHLMAISGLHIALGALLGSLLVRAVQRLLPGHWINWRLPLIAGFTGALLYAVLTGLQPPALRTVVGIGVWYALRLQGRRWSSWEAWLCGLAVILALDPLAVLSQSLWLSCFAVAALIFWYQWVPPPRWQRGRWLLNLLHLQIGLLFLLLPLQVFLFHGVSMVSVAANLCAVPLVTLLIVPLILVGMLLHLSGLTLVESGVWQVTDSLMAGLFWLLYHLPSGWLNVDARACWATLLPWVLIVVWRFHAWSSGLTLWGTLCILLTFPFWRYSAGHAWRVTMLDVGQGLAMVIERNGRAILYDTGLAWPGGDSAQQLIVPWLRWRHLVPDGIIISHEHLDHRGGLNTLAKTWPTAWIRSPLGWKGHQSCQRGERWYWQGLRFQALWPLPGGTERGNNLSCVVRIDDGRFSILLTGDIELAAEKMLISHYWQHVASTIIQVPHHGSLTSSGVTLLQRVNGTLALASAARYNAWHFPAQKIKKRYQQQGYRWLDTPHQGQITLSFDTEGWQIHSLRDQYFRRWYHQWFGDTHDNG